MEVWVEAGDGIDLPDVQSPSVGYRLKLFGRKIPVLPLNRFKVLKNAVRVMRRRARLGQ